MGNFNKQLRMQGCRLISNVLDDTSDMYQFVFNPDKAEFSDIFPCATELEFELTEDGVYSVVTLKVSNARVVDGNLRIGSRTYSAEEITENITSAHPMLNVGFYDIDDMISICQLKKCLAKLELDLFQDLLKSCGATRCKTSEARSQRDFLFIAVWLIEHYLELGNIEKARTIYESIQGCGSICNDLMKNKKDCGCNG